LSKCQSLSERTTRTITITITITITKERNSKNCPSPTPTTPLHQPLHPPSQNQHQEEICFPTAPPPLPLTTAKKLPQPSEHIKHSTKCWKWEAVRRINMKMKHLGNS
jgi:hypothetical protein